MCAQVETTRAQTLGEQVAELVRAIEESKRASQHDADSLLAERDRFRDALDEATAQIERAARLAADECKRQVSVIAERMREEANVRESGLREESNMQLQRLLAELNSLSISQARPHLPISPHISPHLPTQPTPPHASRSARLISLCLPGLAPGSFAPCRPTARGSMRS